MLVLAALAAAWWFWFVPHRRPPLLDGERYGIDVSAHQGAIDWPAVAADEIEFAYVKATEGGDFTDRRFAANWAGAGEAGLDRGAYHFFTLCRPGAEQAEHFLRTVPDGAELAPAVDLELAGNCERRPPRAAVLRELRAFLQGVGEPVVLYLGTDFEDRYDIRPEVDGPLWLRRFLHRPRGDWSIWQVHGWARVEGVDGSVDLDVARMGG